jgi:hypothetical protein
MSTTPADSTRAIQAYLGHPNIHAVHGLGAAAI